MPVDNPKPQVGKPRRGGVVVPHKPTLGQRLAAALVWLLIRCVMATLRFRWDDRSGYFTNPPAGPAIYCIWHNRLGACIAIYHKYVKPRSNAAGLAALISASRDGGFLSAVLEHFQIQPVRGSSSRRGAQALRELTTWTRRRYIITITPDGPRGPKYVVREGVIALGQLAGLPVIPVSYRLGWKIKLKSWDQFQIPLPFSRCDVVIEKPIHIPREISDEAREQLRLQLERTLRAITVD
ncbi:MAG TPA: lysophospholipid acyltransferase family protein [Verrucomicrobiota bacterium]|nr:lysophospholipid acyltransferase family protein [Verrucomicrobiota bacterium]